VKFAPDVMQTLRDALPMESRVLLSLNAKAARTGTPVFTGIPAAEKARRRKAGRVAKASRKRNRVS